VLSIVLLVLNLGLFLVGALFQLFGLAFTDSCPTATCDITAGVDAVFTVASLIAAVGILATIATIVLLVLRFRAWWVPLIAIVATIVGWIVSLSLYLAAIT
jgi:hypothetical protein